ncbi:MAG: EamA family transporter, partial [Chloroflexota bacterium]
MTTAAVLLVVMSAFAHALWNFLAKRAERPEVFTWWMAAAANVILLPLAVYLLITETPQPDGWLFLAATWVLHLVYFLTLSRAYRDGDLSLVYPVARGTGLVMIPIAGVAVLGESVSPPAIAGAAAIVVGIFTLSWWGRFREVLRSPFKTFRAPGMAYAVVTGLVIAAYSAVDKRGVDHVTPMLYMFILTTSGSLGLLPIIARYHAREAFVHEWKVNATTIIAGGLLQFAAYALVLTALQVSRVSYVGPFREIGLVFGVLLGTLVLREPFPAGRILGS